MENQDLCSVAMDNLLFLNKGDRFIANKYKLNHLSFESSEDETFDTIYSLKELEYPLYYTINQLLNEIITSYESDIHGYHKKDIITMLDSVIEMLYQYYDECEENNPLFESFLNDVDDKIFFIQGYYKYGICHCIPRKLNEYLNWFCIKSIQISKEIVNDYLEDMYSPGGYGDSESSDDGGSESSDDDSERSVDSDSDNVNDSSDKIKQSSDKIKHPSDEEDSKKTD